VKAAVLTGPDQPFVIEERPTPPPGPGEALAKVFSCGVGLTVQHVRAGRFPVNYPLVPGHEICGEIVALGDGVRDLALGDAVTAYFYLTCGACRWCRADRETLCENFAGYVGRDVDGGYAEYIKLPSANFIRLPDTLDVRAHAAEVSVICDAVATPVKVVQKARLAAGETVAVFGAGGGLGIHMLMVAKAAGARVIAVETRSDKFAACRDAGAFAVVDASAGDVAEAVQAFTGGNLDVAIDFVSSATTLEAAAAALGRGGRLLTLGGAGENFQLDARRLLFQELEVMGSRYATKGEVIAALELVAAGTVQPLVSETVELDGLEALHQRIEQGLVTGRAAVRIAEP
jgi:propanol-preferring alcohol dehydrogenase